MLEFYVDGQGIVELPHVVSRTHDALAWLAVASVKRWPFEVPRVQCKPVIAKFKMPINFE